MTEKGDEKKQICISCFDCKHNVVLHIQDNSHWSLFSYCNADLCIDHGGGLE